MPLYECLLSADKYCVVFEFGSSYTKCGFAYEYTPRIFIKSNVYVKSLDKVVNLMEINNEQHLFEALKTFIETMYFRYLATNPKDRKVIFSESIFCPTLFRETLAKVFFQHFEVPALIIVPQHLMSLMTLIISTGLVLDVGYNEAVCIPVVDGVTLIEASNFANLGSKELHKRIKEELIYNKAPIYTMGSYSSVTSNELTEKIIEDIKIKTCFVCPFKRSHQIKKHFKDGCNLENLEGCPKNVKYPIHGDKILTIPGFVREISAEILFEEQGEELNIAKLVLDTLIKCPNDCRKNLVTNIVITGGCSMLPGFKHRVQQELKYLVENNEYYKKKLSLNCFAFHKLVCKENYVSWLGASIFGWTDAVNQKAITRDQYLSSKGKIIQDWSSWWPENKCNTEKLSTSFSEKTIRSFSQYQFD